MKQLIIIGARGFGRELSDWAKSCGGYGEDFVVKGFLDDKADALDGYGDYPPILGSVEGHRFLDDEVFAVALGDPKAKKRYAEIALGNGGTPCTLIHETAMVGSNTTIGRGCLILANALVSANCRIGEFSTISFCSDLGHDAQVGAYSHVGAYGFMGGYSRIGSGVTMHPRASLLPRTQVGDWAVVGAGSVCTSNVKPGRTVFGVPARELLSFAEKK